MAKPNVLVSRTKGIEKSNEVNTGVLVMSCLRFQKLIEHPRANKIGPSVTEPSGV